MCWSFGTFKDAPLGIEIRLNREWLHKQRSGTIEFTWDLSRWVGKALCSLPQIEPIAAFWDALLPGKVINVTICQNGNRLMRGRFGGKRLPEYYHSHQRLCTMLRKAREIAIVQRLKTVMPEAQAMQSFDWDDIDIAYDLICGKGYKRSAPNLRKTLEPSSDNDKFPSLFRDSSEVSGFAKIEHRPYSIEAFGENWELGDVVCEMGPISIFLKRQNDGKSFGEIQGKKGTVIRIEKIPPRAATLAPTDGVDGEFPSSSR